MGSRCPSCQQRRWELPQLAADRQARSCDRGDALTMRANRAWWHRPSSPPTGDADVGPPRLNRGREGLRPRPVPGGLPSRAALLFSSAAGVTKASCAARSRVHSDSIATCWYGIRGRVSPTAPIMAAKGLAFDTVILPQLSAGNMPDPRDVEALGGRRRWPVTAACSTSASHGHVRI